MKRLKLLNESLKLVWKSAPGWTLASSAVSLVRSFLPLILLFLVKSLIDHVTAAVNGTGEITLTGILKVITAVTVIFLADEVTAEASGYFRKRQSFRLEDYMYRLLHFKASGLDLINFENPPYFDKLARAVREATWRPNNILNNFISLFRGCISLLLMAGLLFTLSWWAALLLVVVNIPGIWLRLFFSSVLYEFRRGHTPEERKAAYFNWILTGDRPSREIRLFGTGDYFTSLFRKYFSSRMEKELAILKKRAVIDALTGIIKAAALFAVLYMVTDKTLKGEITLGGMAMMVLAFRQGLVSLREILTSVGGLYEDSLFTGDIFEFLDLKEDIKAVEPVAAITRLKSAISFENVSFRYPGNDTPAIVNINLRLPAGKITLLAGSNGSGKSTLVRLLCRLYDPDTGNIYFDGHDIRHFNPAEYRRQFSVLFQDFMLYNLTAGENISLGDIYSGGNMDKIRRAAANAGADKLIESLPAGYDTGIGPLFDASRDLSWGEWQKIALARTFFRDAQVVILDEPSSAIDSETEIEIFSRLRDALKDKTVLLISHRLNTVKLADNIIVLDKGRIAETGSHSELIDLKGRYYELYMRQKRMYTDG